MFVLPIRPLMGVRIIVYQYKKGEGPCYKKEFRRELGNLTFREVLEELDKDFEIPGLIRPFRLGNNPIGPSSDQIVRNGQIIRAFTLNLNKQP